MVGRLAPGEGRCPFDETPPPPKHTNKDFAEGGDNEGARSQGASICLADLGEGRAGPRSGSASRTPQGPGRPCLRLRGGGATSAPSRTARQLRRRGRGGRVSSCAGMVRVLRVRRDSRRRAPGSRVTPLTAEVWIISFPFFLISM